jgi:hypothetical protein
MRTDEEVVAADERINHFKKFLTYLAIAFHLPCIELRDGRYSGFHGNEIFNNDGFIVGYRDRRYGQEFRYADFSGNM